MGSLKAGVLSAAVALIAVGCGSTSPAQTPPATAPAASPTPSAPSGPPTAQVSLVGDSSIAGAMQIATVECSFPSVSGEEIFVTGTALNKSTSIHLTLTAASVAVVADIGSGTTFRARTFSGTGVSGFGATTGAQLSGPLTETTATAADGTGVGKLTSITATISCAGQTNGSTTLTMSGTVTGGAMSGGITQAHVLCIATNEVETLGLVQVGGSPAFTIVFALQGRFTVDLVPMTNVSAFFVSAASATSTTTTTTAMVSGDAAEEVTAGATVHTIHVSGQSTCGSAITP